MTMSRNGISPTEGIDTSRGKSQNILRQSRNEGRPTKGIDTNFATFMLYLNTQSRNGISPTEGIDTFRRISSSDNVYSVEMV